MGVEGVTPLELFYVSFGVTGSIGFALWLASIPLRNASIVDIFWGPLFVAVALFDALLGGGDPTRRWLMFGAVAVWGCRLAIHLAMRNVGHGEDRRYVAMRKKRGDSFWWRSLYIVFGFQAVLASIIAWPIHAASGVVGVPFGVVGFIGLAIVLIGVVVEATADAQLDAFKRDPTNKGGVMDRGLWRYSRHPNYFGDAVVWWGFGLIALETGAWYALLGPALMTLLLLKVSGVALLEKTIKKRRPAYEAYVRRTSAFIPWPPREC